MTIEILAQRLVDAPMHVVRRLFERDWPTDVGNASQHAPAGQTSLGWPGSPKRLVMRASAPQDMYGKTIVPVSWRAEPLATFFPALEAYVELVPASGDRTDITFWARYDQPFGKVGRAIERSFARRIARSTVESIVTEVRNRSALPRRPRS